MSDMAVWPEVWPVAADQEGLWLLSGVGPWQSRLPVPADSTIHAEVELTLGDRHTGHDVDLDTVLLLHSTSWREDRSSMVPTYIAVVEPPTGYVRRTWPAAAPISPLLPGAVGKPLTHAPAAPPNVRHVDVLLHALRHLAFLRLYDETAAAILENNPLWKAHLRPLKPALAGLYNQQHPKAA